MTATLSSSTTPQTRSLRRIYLARFAFAAAWTAILISTSPTVGPLLTVLLVLYPLVDAAAVLWQLQTEDRQTAPRLTEMINVGVSLVITATLAWASTVSIAAALGVWGAWAAASGATQLATALQRRHIGGQTPQIVSGSLSIAAGIAFLAESFRDTATITGVGGYAALGGIFFLISAIRLSILQRR